MMKHADFALNRQYERRRCAPKFNIELAGCQPSAITARPRCPGLLATAEPAGRRNAATSPDRRPRLASGIASRY